MSSDVPRCWDLLVKLGDGGCKRGWGGRDIGSCGSRLISVGCDSAWGPSYPPSMGSNAKVGITVGTGSSSMGAGDVIDISSSLFSCTLTSCG